MKILIIGGSGIIGYNLIQYLIKRNNVHYTFLQNSISEPNGHYLDITNKTSTIKLIKKIRPDVIIHTAALTNVERCEKEKEFTYSINVEGTKNIVEGAKLVKSKIVYVSTSAVFSGDKDEYFEDDKVDPISNYGLTKAEAEKIVKNSGLKYMILRTDQPYYWNKKWQHTNSVLRVLDTLRSDKTFKEITDWYNAPTYVPDFVEATARLLELEETGIFHLVGPDFVSRFDWALLTCDVFGLDSKKIQKIDSNRLNLMAKRSNVKLNNRKITEKTGIRFIGIQEGLNNMKKQEQRKNNV